MVKTLTVTWNYSTTFNLQDTFLYRSFIKKNPESNLIHLHYNRNDFQKLETEFENRFGYQYEYLLYKIFLTRSKLDDLDFSNVVFVDANDVVCLGDIQLIPKLDYILFSAENNQYPSSMGDWGGLEYSKDECIRKRFLNAGLFTCTKENYIALLDQVIKNILSKNLKTLGGDQGAFIFYYLSNFDPKIILDKENKYFLSTFMLDYNKYNSTHFPLFIHDNGWNWGSPRFIEKFNLV
jgi:hypothetical protein